jgi:hypothetical protein
MQEKRRKPQSAKVDVQDVQGPFPRRYVFGAAGEEVVTPTHFFAVLAASPPPFLRASARETCQLTTAMLQRSGGTQKLTGSLLLPHNVRGGLTSALELGAAHAVARLLHVEKKPAVSPTHTTQRWRLAPVPE